MRGLKDFIEVWVRRVLRSEICVGVEEVSREELRWRLLNKGS